MTLNKLHDFADNPDGNYQIFYINKMSLALGIPQALTKYYLPSCLSSLIL